MPSSARSTTTWARALTLRERRGAIASVSNPERAAHRLERWKSQPPFGETELFRQRLEQDQLTEAELLALLGEPAHRLARRLPKSSSWAAGLVDTFAHVSIPRSRRSALLDQAELALLAAVEPLVEHASARIRMSAQAIATGAAAPFDPNTVSQLRAVALPGRLFPMLARTMALELHLARLAGHLHGESSSERFWSFIDRLRTPEGALAVLESYPVLARQIWQSLEDWTETSVEFLTRLAADAGPVHALFSTTRDLGRLVAVDGGLSDPHQGGRGVLIARFSSGTRVVYKPKSLAVDRHFQQLLQWANARGLEPAQWTLTILDRGSYGWVELVEPQGCTSPAEVERFYARQGGLLALLHVLAATDFHYENVIAVGEHPILIDLEALFHPNLRTPDPADGFMNALAHLDASVLSVGLLPQLMRLNPGAAGLDVSGLGAAAGQLSPRGVPVWEGGATDTARVVYERVPLNPGVHRPTLDGEPVDVLDYSEPLLEGFSAAYRLLVDRRAELLAHDSPLARFVADEVRLLLRPTVVYGRMLAESFHPDLLRDALERDRFFDRLWVAVPFQPRLVPAIRHEQADLLRGDIPKFTTRPASRDVTSASGAKLPEFVEQSGLDVARERVLGLSQSDLERQLWFARAALGSLPGADAQRPLRPVIDRPAVSASALVESARRIGDRLGVAAFRGDRDAAWVGLTSTNGLSVAPLGSDLYEGLPGIAFFLAYLGHVTGDERYAQLARRALVTLRRVIKDNVATPSTVGAFSGWGGVVYTLTHLGALWAESALLDEAHALLEVLPHAIEHDEHLDIASGAAGCLGALLALHAHAPSADILEVAAVCGERLLQTAQPMPRGVGWPTPGTGGAALAGFAHGAAGIAWALPGLASATGDPRFAACARDALAYERSLFSSETQNWPDLRANSVGTMVAWCHGAAGVGLGRLSMLDGLVGSERTSALAEIDAALATTVARGSGMSHSLCHGDLGNIDLLVSAGLKLSDPRWLDEARRWAGGLLAISERDGWLCATPFGLESPGLMTGLAGIGYGLLRAAAPEHVPSILVLEPPRAIATSPFVEDRRDAVGEATVSTTATVRS